MRRWPSWTGRFVSAKEGAVVVLHALFDLKEEVAESEFRAALEGFCDHLQREGYARGWRWMRQIEPSGPSFPRPTQKQFVAIEFADEPAAQRCYEYVYADAEPIRSLHRLMNSKVQRDSALFFECADA
jgi:hypothetical protein